MLGGDYIWNLPFLPARVKKRQSVKRQPLMQVKVPTSIIHFIFYLHLSLRKALWLLSLAFLGACPITNPSPVALGWVSRASSKSVVSTPRRT